MCLGPAMPVRRKRADRLAGKLVMAVLASDDEQAIAPCRCKYSRGRHRRNLFRTSESGNQRPESLDVDRRRSHMTTIVCERRGCEIRAIYIADVSGAACRGLWAARMTREESRCDEESWRCAPDHHCGVTQATFGYLLRS
jgi:hypothetical protein